MKYKLGSLFDGSGGFPFAGTLCNIDPVWASEIEPYPIAVTRSRFPYMKHLGDISRVSGAEIEPVDIITFGSPCQDLSVAGKRAGLKHEVNGDEETTRSGLFMEAVRIIKEMRGATNGRYPTFVLWENVPGAFSSSRGEDFRTVLEELIRIVEPNAAVPDVPKAGWAYADSYRGDGWSLAYRVFDAQYWGVPQRRRRIHLVLDLRGERAREVLFEREGVRGYFAKGGTTWQGTTDDTSGGTEATDREGSKRGSDVTYNSAHPTTQAFGFCAMAAATAGSIGYQEEVAPTLRAGMCPDILYAAYDARGNGDGKTVSTITGDHENRITDYTSVVCEPKPVYCLQGNGIDRADTAGCNGKGWREDSIYTLNTIDHHAVAYAMDVGFFNTHEDVSPTLLARMYKDPHLVTFPENAIRYIVRRLTPLECARLQGFPDWWSNVVHKDSFTEEEYRFWLNVRNTHAAINGKAAKDYTIEQMLKWYNGLHTDSAEYKMWGNGIALPPALYVMQGIKDALERED